MFKSELLAPAGNRSALEAAVCAGADAVYLGGTLFNARASASNFDKDGLKEAVDFCHLRKVKVYVTVNILIGDREFAELEDFIRYIDQIGVDAIIVQDIGAAMFVKSIAPALSLHASTQMTVYDTEGAEFLASLGFKRVVTARELSYEKIREITANCGIETEIFVHGAMCVSYSGQCLMSSMIGGRSGNRGKCAQPCRLMYTAGKKSGTLMSLKDMCLIDYLEKIRKCSVASLKIEGRMKGPDYVGTVVSIYRKYLDSKQPVTETDRKALEAVFFRGGFSDGYFQSNKGKEMFCHKKPDNPYLKQSKALTPEIKFKKTALYMYFSCRVGERAKLTVIDEYGNTAQCFSNDVAELSKKSEPFDGKIKDSLKKLGNTVFYPETVEVNSDADAFIPVSSVNDMRRRAVECIQNQIIASYRRETVYQKPDTPSFSVKPHGEFEISVFVNTPEQLKAVRQTDCKRIYAPLRLSKYFDGNEIAVLPRVSHGNLKQCIKGLANREFLVRNIGQLNIVKECEKEFSVDFTMNVFNSRSAEFYKNIGTKYITLSVELSLAQIKDITKAAECEAVIYGKVPLMLTENCILKASSGCSHGGYLKDRTGEKFLVGCLEGCRNEIFNSVPIVMSDKTDDLNASGIAFGRLDFTDETAEKCVQIYNSYKNNTLIGGKFTRGKFYKGV